MRSAGACVVEPWLLAHPAAINAAAVSASDVFLFMMDVFSMDFI
jgi:hypothetical protein